ncbi:Polyubiquitin-B, protein [Aphelenchoides fujianensis]|nr:Polyubiquitin-B, protein [Aphelenchoides fujianensis]
MDSDQVASIEAEPAADFWFKVISPAGHSVLFRNDGTVHTVGQLKHHLEQRWLVPPHQQPLFCDGQWLDEDDCPLKHVIPGGGSIVEFCKREPVPLAVQPPPQSKEALCEAIGVLRAEVRKRRQLNVFVEWLRRDQFDDFDRELRSICFLESPPLQRIPIAVSESVEADGPLLQLEVKSTDAVGDVKMRVYGKLGFDFDYSMLLLNGWRVADERSVASLNLTAREKPVFQFRCLRAEKKRRVQPADTEESLRSELQAVRDELHGMPPPSPGRLQKWNEEVDALTSHAEKLKASEGQERFGLEVRSVTGLKSTVSVYPDCTVANLKAKIQDMQGVPPHKQRLIFAGSVLEDGRTLNDYNVRAGATMHLVLGLRGTALINYTDCQKVPEHADFFFGPFDVVLAHRPFEHDFALLMRRVGELRALVHSKADRQLVRNAMAQGYEKIAAGRRVEQRAANVRRIAKLPPLPAVEDGGLVRYWRKAMSDLHDELALTKRSTEQTAAELAAVEREMEELRLQLKRRQPNSQ